MDEYVIAAIFYICIIVPVLVYVGIQRANTSEYVFKGLLGLGIILFLYHLYGAYIKWRAGSSNFTLPWSDFLYIVISIPLIWIGFYEKEASRQHYDMLLLLAFGSLGFNLYTIILHTSTVTGGRD
jgi:hypothetical protein